ncbi:LysR substrate-binding domain-containing protein [Methylobacterium sp. J-090]|uniref:LysR substrate-binding domain-containing protein n=1 Tax=Methylobacterium sp. J-090 TaxID=2836666 RepID=UPI001FB91EC0|nr:LysR substrate-binding domain-containing protein [Methylobacterium sp. J-090]MCJ2081940.1 LysR substrate-binding domain-containing protein [Methylobacterium sp. J-090]
MDVLRSFVTGVDLGGFAKAATRLGRSPSAVSLQLRKLEDQVGRPLFRKQGRGLTLTEAGETLLGYARRLLDLNDTALAALRVPALSGDVRVGLPQDFAETHFPTVLARFARAHPGVRIEARVERNAELRAAFEAGDLDLVLLWREDNGLSRGETVIDLPMVWVGPHDGYRHEPGQALPLVAFDAPCLFRRAALAALDEGGIPWRTSFSSPSLTGLWAAVAAGLGVTVRTPHGLPPALSPLDPTAAGLPKLPCLSLSLLSAGSSNPTAEHLTTVLRESFAGGAIQLERGDLTEDGSVIQRPPSL